jgi:hypothetical protein
MARNPWAVSIVALGCALAAGQAGAGELFSAPVTATEGQTLSCTAVNASRKQVRLHVDLFEGTEYDGTPTSSGTVFGPGGSSGAAHGGPITAFCRVSHSGNKKNVRAMIQVSESGTILAMMPLQ